MPSIVDQIPASLRDRFVADFRHGKYSLLLGAGASCDSTDSSGRNLPLAAGLTTEINDISGTRQSNLADAYDIAIERNPKLLEEYFASRFTNCQPSPWMNKIRSCIWKRIWTLNVDDVVEQVYGDPNGQGQLLSASYSWTDDIVDDFGLQVVHLHGKVRPGSPLDLVFSITDYVNTIENKRSWIPLFFNSWVGSPFITIGATLFAEYDLARAIRVKQPIGKSPSLYITRTIRDDMREQLEIRNLVGIELDASSAAEELFDLTSETRQTARYQWQSTAAASHHIATFASRFDILSLNDSYSPPGHDFFLGFEPLWDDAVNRKIAAFDWHESIGKKVEADLAGGMRQCMHVVFSSNLSGKTCGAYSSAIRLVEAGYSVFKFRGEQTIDVSSTIAVLEGRGPSLLLYDGVADFSQDVYMLLEEAERRNVKIVVLALERSSRRQIVIEDIPAKYLTVHDRHSVTGLDRLSRRSARILVEHVRRHGRYARFHGMGTASLVNQWENRNVFDVMSELEFGQGYRDRIRPQFEALPDDNARLVVFLASFLNSFGYAMPIFLTQSIGVQSRDFRNLSKAREFTELVSIEGGRLTCRYRSSAINSIRAAIHEDVIINALISMMVSLAPYVNRRTRKTRNLEYRILRATMRARGLMSVVRKSKLEYIYDEIAEAYSHESAFWEQRSIACQLAGNYVSATSYAAKAVDLAPKDVRRRTTFGRLLILRSYNDVKPGSPESWDLYGQGRDELIAAESLTPNNGVVLLNRFRQTLLLYRELISRAVDECDFQDDFTALEADIATIYKSCLDSSSLRQTAEYNTVSELYGLFMQLRFVRTGEFDTIQSRHVLSRQPPSIGEW
ncbi:hypothetical protein [Nocardia bhagyanarayanae]|uniref:Novel STAND NTPase 5 domain-containing protein n=1 Tax=Nocardia bhagyanarayanae TaxID=1215925 RepID=A0A543F8B9_9NOCA|nr:hypothetical protein [Nocardia bhagyanarayanae]TQM30087.1 hypothetical protein FB390_1703 [Nocardia bhagyanarayanae]